MTAATVIGVVLTMIAVAVSGRGQREAAVRHMSARCRRPLGFGPCPRPRQHQPWPGSGGRESRVGSAWLRRGLRAGWARIAESLRASRAAAGELAEARELLAYWEQRRAAPALGADAPPRGARDGARWRERVRAAEQVRYGRGLLGAASQLAVERRMPTTVAHRGRQALRLAACTAVDRRFTLVLVLAAAVAVVAEAVLGAL